MSEDLDSEAARIDDKCLAGSHEYEGSAHPTIAVIDPVSGECVGEYPIDDADAVSRSVEKARSAAGWWASIGFDGRRRWLRLLGKEVARKSRDVARVISAETGKPADDAFLEVMLAVEHLAWAGRHARNVLRRRRVGAGLASFNQVASVGYEPVGVVGVIGPWNYPLYTPMGTISYALAAGNAVVFKPSELSPGVGRWLADAWDRLGAPHSVVSVVTGDGSTGDALVRSGVDKVAFTGSAATARRVMAACAENLTPLVVEGGGKDAMIVTGDADLEAASKFAIFGAFGNGGQTCAGVERIYVHSSVADDFIGLFAKKAATLRPGGRGAEYGPMTMPAQVGVIKAHIDDALSWGGRAVVGGPVDGQSRLVAPVVLVDVPEDSDAVTQETFGPVVVINRFDDLDDAVARANSTTYGLGASVFTSKRSTAESIARQLRVGVVTIGSVLGFAGIPSLPFGGVGDSGFGRIHGADGLREFSRCKSITRQKFPLPMDVMSLRRKRRDMIAAEWLLRLRHGR